MQGRQNQTSEDPTFRAKSRTTWEIVRRVAPFLRPYLGLAFANIACALLATAFGLVFPKMVQWLIDAIREGRPINFGWFSLCLLGAFFLRDLGHSLRIIVNNIFEQNVIFDMRRQVYARLQRLPVGYFDQRASGDLMTRVIEDINSVERLLIDGTEQSTVALFTVIGVAAFLFSMSPKLALVTLIPTPLLMVGVMWYTFTAHDRYRAQRQASSAMNALLMDNLQGIRQIKAFARQGHEDERFSQRADDLRRSTLRVMKVWAIYSPAMAFCASLGMVLVFWVGGSMVAANTLTIGKLVGFALYIGQLYGPLNQFHGLNQMLQQARAAGERVFDIFDATAEQTAGGHSRDRVLPAPVRGDVQYENVAFGYGAERTALQNISLHARPGQMIALVGPTGAGKSTLVNLLPAFYEITAGRITIDGHDTRHLTLESLREHISVVSQEAFLFNGTVRENILYGKLDATDDEMLAAARAANCHDFIIRLPEGFDSRVGERGVKLSVGEKQRVSIARALLKNSPILILDEATASVDTATEKLIQEALERLMAHRTSFVIAHRLSTIRNADQILVLLHGEIVERGSHAELLERAGLYARLCRIQNTTFIEEGFEKITVAEAGSLSH